jgi:hypothetical protein
MQLEAGVVTAMALRDQTGQLILVMEVVAMAVMEVVG